MANQGADAFSRELSRRELFKYGLAGSAALATAGYAGRLADLAWAGPDAATGTIETWSPDTRPDALASEKWWDAAFMKANPDATVKQLTVPYGQDTTKLQAGSKTGIVPDIIWAYTDLLVSYGQDGWRHVNDGVKPSAEPFARGARQHHVPGERVLPRPFVASCSSSGTGRTPPKSPGPGRRWPTRSCSPTSRRPTTRRTVRLHAHEPGASDTFNPRQGVMWTTARTTLTRRPKLALDRRTIAAWNCQQLAYAAH
jgi:hypothetical protein